MTASIIIINWRLLGHGFFALGELVTPAPVVRSQHFITHVTQEVQKPVASYIHERSTWIMWTQTQITRVHIYLSIYGIVKSIM